MNSKTLKTLEFDKITEKLSAMAVMDLTKDRIKNLKICDNIKKVNRLQDETAQAIQLLVKKGSVPIGCASDIRSSLKRSRMQGILSMGEILYIGKVLETSEKLKVYPDDIKCDALEEHFESLYTDKALRKKIFDIILDEDNIADNASGELYDIRRALNHSSNKVRDILHSIITSQTYQAALQEQIITMRGDRFVVPVKATHRGEIKGILHDTSSSGATLFIEPMSVVEANNKIRELKTKEKLNRILAANTNQPIEKIRLDTDRDFYLDAEEAKEYGLIDEIFYDRKG